MSEAIPGFPVPAEPSPPIDSAAVILVRRTPAGPEVYWQRRGAGLSFAPGFHAFPGGRLDPADARVAVEGAQGETARWIAAAAREVLEETGILLARGPRACSPEQVRTMRRALLEGKGEFSQLLVDAGVKLEGDSFLTAGRYVTPEFVPRRFDCRFFLAQAPAGQEAEPWPGEVASGGWIRPVEALRLWEEGIALLHPPALDALRFLAESPDDLVEAARRMRSPPHLEGFISRRIEFQKGIRTVPLRTPTLPPATHTNCYLLGHGELLLVDPGADEPEELRELIRTLAEHRADGLTPRAILLTHHHRDHVGGVQRLQQETELPVWCHPITAQKLGLSPERALGEGDRIELGGALSMRWRVLHTPGHAPGHLTLVDERSRAAVVGDMVAGVGTILIDPGEGDMAEYLRQLERLRQLPVAAIYPAHGPAIADGPAKLSEYLQHRRQREQQVLEAVRQGAGSLEAIAAAAYADTPIAPSALTEPSTLAILVKLRNEGRIWVDQDQNYRLAPTE